MGRYSAEMRPLPQVVWTHFSGSFQLQFLYAKHLNKFQSDIQFIFNNKRNPFLNFLGFL